MAVLGIDFGTSNTVAVLAGDGRAPWVLSIDGNAWMPSCVFVDDDGSLIAGRDAERGARIAPERFEPNPKRRIDDGEILLGARVVPVVDAVAAVLRRVGEEARRQLGGRNPDRIRLTHPAQWGSARQNVLLAAARAAGLGGAITLLPEPVGAATHFASLPGNTLPHGAALAVYDLGGGTFDCAVVGSSAAGYSVLAEGGLPDVGGVDFDQVILDHLGRTVAVADPGRWQSLTTPRSAADRRAARSLRAEVRAAKETLSRYAQTDLPLPDPFQDTLLTRRELEGLIRPAIVRTVEVLAATIERAGLTPQQLAGIYLVGGSSRVPLVATVIAEKLELLVTALDQPETSVAMGAAISGALPGSGLPHPSGRTQTVDPGSGPRQVAGGARPAARPLRATTAGPVSVPHAAAPIRGPLGAVSSPADSPPAMSSPGAPPSGPASAPLAAGGAARTPTRSSPVVPGRTDTPAVASGHSKRRVQILVAIAAAVIVAAVIVVITVTSGSPNTAPEAGSNPSATSSGAPLSSAADAPTTSAGDSTSPGSPAQMPTVPASCESAPIATGNGMTPCLQSVAGPNEHRALACMPAAADEDVQEALGARQIVAASACAGLAGGVIDVVYVQLNSADDVDSALELFASELSVAKRDWHSGNGSGWFVAKETADRGPEIYWSYDTIPVIAYATTDSDVQPGQQVPTADDLGRFWQESLLPQAAS